MDTEDTDQAANKGWVAPVEGEFTLVLEAEAMGVCEALSWLLTLPYMKISVETDSLTTVNAICKAADYRLEVGHTPSVPFYMSILLFDKSN